MKVIRAHFRKWNEEGLLVALGHVEFLYADPVDSKGRKISMASMAFKRANQMQLDQTKFINFEVVR